MGTFYAAGSAELHAIGNDWDTVHDQASADNVYDGAPGVWVYIFAGVYQISRGGISFEISSVSVASAIISLYCTSLDTSEGDFDLHLVNGDDLLDTLVAADYGDLLDETVSYGSINSADITLNAWNDITLNAAGISALEAAMIAGDRFRVGMRHSKDIDDVAPVTSESYFWCAGYDDANKPELVIPSLAYTQAFIIG